MTYIACFHTDNNIKVKSFDQKHNDSQESKPAMA